MATLQAHNVAPPRRGAVIALAVDTTARPYDLSNLALDGYVPKENNAANYIYVTLQAVGGDVWFYFDSATGSALDDTAKIAAAGAIAFANTYGWRLPQNQEMRLRIERASDKFLVVKTSAGAATLLLRASSENFAG